jgi:hypothetical protein
VRGVPCLIVRLPDGTPGTVEVQATSAGTAESEPPPAVALLSAVGCVGCGVCWRLVRRRQRRVGSPAREAPQLEEVNPVRGLESCASRQLALPLEGPKRIDRLWESFSPAAQERILRRLARAIAHVLTQREGER